MSSKRSSGSALFFGISKDDVLVECLSLASGGSGLGLEVKVMILIKTNVDAQLRNQAQTQKS